MHRANPDATRRGAIAIEAGVLLTVASRRLARRRGDVVPRRRTAGAPATVTVSR